MRAGKVYFFRFVVPGREAAQRLPAPRRFGRHARGAAHHAVRASRGLKRRPRGLIPAAHTKRRRSSAGARPERVAGVAASARWGPVRADAERVCRLVVREMKTFARRIYFVFDWRWPRLDGGMETDADASTCAPWKGDGAPGLTLSLPRGLRNWPSWAAGCGLAPGAYGHAHRAGIRSRD